MILAKNLTPFPIARTIPRRVMTAFGMMAGLSMAGPAIAQTTTARPSLPAHNAQTAHFSRAGRCRVVARDMAFPLFLA